MEDIKGLNPELMQEKKIANITVQMYNTIECSDYWNKYMIVIEKDNIKASSFYFDLSDCLITFDMICN